MPTRRWFHAGDNLERELWRPTVQIRCSCGKRYSSPRHALERGPLVKLGPWYMEDHGRVMNIIFGYTRRNENIIRGIRPSRGITD